MKLAYSRLLSLTVIGGALIGRCGEVILMLGGALVRLSNVGYWRVNHVKIGSDAGNWR